MHRLHGDGKFGPPTTERSEIAVRGLNQTGSILERDSFTIFRGLKRQEVDAIRKAAVKRTFRISEIVIGAEERALHFFLLEHGLVDYIVETADGRKILLQRLVRGDPFGLAALLSDPTGYLCTAIAVRDTEALVWQHHIIHDLGMTYPRLLENALRIGLRYVALHAKRHIAIVSNTAQERVAYALANLASRTGHPYSNGLEVDVKNEELASLADVNSYSVSRFLQQWNRDGTVRKSRGKILIQSPEHLLVA